MISVAMASYNGEAFIKKQLDSILAQTLAVDEIVIVDDGSSDTTIKMIKDYQEKYQDKIMLYENKKNLGYRKNFMKALSLTKGDYIFLCDQDDMWMKNKVEVMINMIKNHDIQLLCSSFDVIDEFDQPVTIITQQGYCNKNYYKREVLEDALVQIPLEDLVYRNSCQGCSMLMTRELCNQFLEVADETLPHDWELNMLAASRNGSYFYNHPLFLYRRHSHNTIGIALSLDAHKTSKEKMALQSRIELIEYGIKTFAFMKKVDKHVLENPDMRKRCLFLMDNYRAINEKKLFLLLRENMSPYYHEVKTFKGRIADILYVIKR